MTFDKYKFKKDFLAAKLLNVIQKDFEVILIWVAGSTLTGLTDTESDIDLGVLIAEETLSPQNTRNEDYLIYKPTNTKVQWIYDTVSDITTLQPYANQRNIGWAQLCCVQDISDDTILYVNPKYFTFVEYLIDNRNKIATYSMWLYFKDKSRLINQILHAGRILEDCQVKSLYHLCWTADILLKESHDTRFLKALKRIRSMKVSDEDLCRAFNKIYKLNEYFLNNIPEKPILKLKEVL